jgi:hypothetical protein
MTREDKITQILALAGVPNRDANAARANYSGMKIEEIDSRLDKLERASAVVENWRSKRRTPALAADRNGEVISVLQESQESVERVDRLLERLAGVLAEPGKYQRSHFSRWVRAYRSIAGMLEHSRPVQGFVEDCLTAVAASNFAAATLARHEIGQVLKHPVLPSSQSWLSATDTVNAVARIANAMSRATPDLLVAVNEGEAIASLLKVHMHLDAPILEIIGSADADMRWADDAQLFGQPRVIWVVGHVAKSGRSLMAAMAQARSRFENATVYGAVLAASVEAAENLAKFHFHQLSESLVRLTFDTSKGVAVFDDNFILGANAKDPFEELQLNRSLLVRAQKDMAKLYPFSFDLFD